MVRTLQTLGPLLEKVVDEYDGKVVLAKVNVDENPQASQQFRVQGIPAVYGFRDGKSVDGFVGRTRRAWRARVHRAAGAQRSRQGDRAAHRRR